MSKAGVQTDLPDRLGAITVKELRQCMRRTSFVFPFIFIHVLASFAVFVEFHRPPGSGAGGTAAVFLWNAKDTGPFWWVVLAVCGFGMPLAGFFLMPQETDEGNHELLLLTPLSRWQVVLGKYLTLWGLSVLTLTSLLPYMVIRYFIGGIEWFVELAHSGTVIAAAGILSAGTLAASGFKTTASKLCVFTLFLLSAVSGGAAGMIGGGMALSRAENSGHTLTASIFYHLSAAAVVICYAILGMLLARSRIRLATMDFELKPSTVLLIILGLAPFIIGMVAAFTCGHGSIAGLFILILLAWNSDITPKAPPWLPPPPPNIPPEIPKP